MKARREESAWDASDVKRRSCNAISASGRCQPTWSTAPSAVFPCGVRPRPHGAAGLPHGTTFPRLISTVIFGPCRSAPPRVHAPLQGAGAWGGGCSGGIAALDPRLISVAPSGHFSVGSRVRPSGTRSRGRERSGARTEPRPPVTCPVGPCDRGSAEGRTAAGYGGRASWSRHRGPGIVVPASAEKFPAHPFRRKRLGTHGLR